VDENTDFCMPQLSSEEVGFSRSRECKHQFFVHVGFGEGLVFDFGFEAEQSRHNIRALDFDHESDLSLRVELYSISISMEIFVDPGPCHVPFSLA